MFAAGILAELRDGAGFWLPDAFVDRYVEQLGPRGVLVYLRLARTPTLAEYPALRELAACSGLSRPKVARLLLDMNAMGLLNEHDLERIEQEPL
jgi:hypothetical protein